ncbi:Uncharacterised protein [Vibrio cholerae]|uniref:Uncharacterized protein n=1 Tax=Vibrio cholerae TaxID=666 RepID=A0A655QCE4_VIBCL|nr:Uncharacterised protein [Vibrio cholerae]CSI52607.1 Uncharacterised protein [Vibrio cholerae]
MVEKSAGSSCIRVPGCIIFATLNNTFPVPERSAWRWKISISPNNKPFCCMLSNSLVPIKGWLPAQCTLSTITSSFSSCGSCTSISVTTSGCTLAIGTFGATRGISTWG